MKEKSIAAAAVAILTATGHVLAADLPTQSLPPPSPAAIYNRTGFHLGINGGFGTGNSNWSDGLVGTTCSFPISCPRSYSNVWRQRRCLWQYSNRSGSSINLRQRNQSWLEGWPPESKWPSLSIGQSKQNNPFVDLPNASCTMVGNCGGAAGSIVTSTRASSAQASISNSGRRDGVHGQRCTFC
jgi:hypothetical protein